MQQYEIQVLIEKSNRRNDMVLLLDVFLQTHKTTRQRQLTSLAEGYQIANNC